MRYPAIGDYAFISDCHSSALVSSTGAIDWCCMPRFDSSPVFGRLLDWERGGFCALRPAGEHRVTQSYLSDTLVLETTFRAPDAEVAVLDCFTIRKGGSRAPYRQLLRVIEGRAGEMEMLLEVAPRFDYAEVRPWMRRCEDGMFTAIGGNDALVVSFDHRLEVSDQHDLRARFTIRSGERVRLSLVWAAPETIDPRPPSAATARELDERLDATVAWWRAWASALSRDGADDAAVRRSALVLKGLINAPTGAVVAAATTSLPESPGGERNWDYRFTWVRDSLFAVRSLAELGPVKEADGFRRFIERSAAGSIEALQIMYGVGGERRLPEIEIAGLDGYRGARPVRTGNAAAHQDQFDVFGDLLDLAWRWHCRGRSPDDDYWRFLVGVVDHVAERWAEPDRGIWEFRDRARQYVFSKAMAWVALDRGVRIAQEAGRDAPVEKWVHARDQVRAAFDQRGFNADRNTFVQELDGDVVDAALLLLPTFDVVAYDDPRMIGTVAAIRSDLDDHGFVRRYLVDDGLKGTEGAFLACTFWLVECLAHQGQLEAAREYFDRAAGIAGKLGLYAEEYDTQAREMVGNYPQALTHLAHIGAALALRECRSTKSGTPHA